MRTYLILLFCLLLPLSMPAPVFYQAYTTQNVAAVDARVIGLISGPTNGASLATITNVINGMVPTIVVSNAQASLFATNLVNYGLSSNMMDNPTWYNVQAASLDANMNWGHWLITNTPAKIRANTQFRMLSLGAGFTAGGLTDGAFTQITNVFPLAGFMGSGNGYGMVFQGSHTETGGSGSSTNPFSLGPYVETWLNNDYAGLATTGNAPGTNFLADIFGLMMICGPDAGTVDIRTNINGVEANVYTGVNLNSNIYTMRTIWWTNANGPWNNPNGLLFYARATSNGTNRCIGGFMINSRITNGVVYGNISASSSGSQYWGSITNMVKTNTVDALAPDAVIQNWVGDTNQFWLNQAWAPFHSNAPQADLIYAQSHPFNNNEGDNGLTCLNINLGVSKTNNVAFFDGWSVWQGTNNMQLRGYESSDQTHPTASGYVAYGAFLSRWVNFKAAVPSYSTAIGLTTFPASSAALTLNNARWLAQISSAGALTNVLVASPYTWSILVVSNSAATTNTFTLSCAARIIGPSSTNVLSVPPGKMAYVSIDALANVWTNIVTAIQQ